MNQSDKISQPNEWHAYYDRFSYFSADVVREGCHPRIMQHSPPSNKAVVLIHGLGDSPYLMVAIGEYFFNQLGYDVYLPLLHGHGLKEPEGMESVSKEEWKANASFALKAASEHSEFVSIGGLSTGGLISFFMGATNPLVTGSLYLFSAALDLAGGRLGLIGEIKERFLRSFLPDVLERQKPLISDRPYRYSHLDFDGAQEVAKLIKESDQILSGYSSTNLFPKRVFAAHWVDDPAADIAGIEALQRVSYIDNFHFFKIPKEVDVTHPGLVLDQPIEKDGKVFEKANPRFAEMMAAMAIFERSNE